MYNIPEYFYHQCYKRLLRNIRDRSRKLNCQDQSNPQRSKPNRIESEWGKHQEFAIQAPAPQPEIKDLSHLPRSLSSNGRNMNTSYSTHRLHSTRVSKKRMDASLTDSHGRKGIRRYRFVFNAIERIPVTRIWPLGLSSRFWSIQSE